MSYSPEVYSRVQKLYEERRSRALTDLEGRIGQAKEQVPGLAPVEEVLGATGVRVMEAIKKKDGGKAERDRNIHCCAACGTDGNGYGQNVRRSRCGNPKVCARR